MPRKPLALLTALMLLPTCAAQAHFPWLVTNADGRAELFFGESLTHRDYHLPEAVERAKVRHAQQGSEAATLAMPLVEEEDFMGRRSASPLPDEGELSSVMVYGVYHGSKLTYYAQHDLSVADPVEQPKEEPAALRVELGRAEEQGVSVRVLWRGEPLADAGVSLFNAKGESKGSADTDESGVVTFPGSLVESGLNGLLVGHMLEDAKGEHLGKPYTSESHYLTATFHNTAENQPGVPPLPEPVASFGAAVADGWLYVYSGHTGTAHDHSKENLSQGFRRCRLDGAGGWEALPMGPPLQGLALVAHGGKLYRVGGMQARNASGEAEDLHSLRSFACFDPATSAWTELPSLPEGRSSHNAVVMGDTLYVVGGWKLAGDGEGEWHAGALAYDLAEANAAWRPLTAPPQRRRALAVSHLGGKLVALGGMSDSEELTTELSFYEPATGEWTTGPEFPGKPFHSFGLAAWNLDGDLFACGMEGVVYRLGGDASAWKEAGRLATGRFFHQLLPDCRGGLLAVAGASSEGHLATIERISAR